MSKVKLADPATDPVLRRFRAALEEIYGDRIERVVLFGSRARGDAHRESDYDVALFLKDLSDPRVEARRLSALETDLIDETGELVHAIPFRAGAWRNRTPLMHEIRLDGIDLRPVKTSPPLNASSDQEHYTEMPGTSPEA